MNKNKVLSSLMGRYGYDDGVEGDYWILPEVALLNTTIITGLPELGETVNYTVEALTIDEVREWLPYGFTSYIGHESTAAIMSALTGQEITMNRQQYTQHPGQFAIAFKLNGRAPEGVILSAEEIEKIGYSWYLIKRG